MNVICFGDSNTYGYDPRSYLGGRYPADLRWVDILAQRTGWTVRNEGLNGREIPRRAMAVPPATDRLIVMLGTNDLLQGADAQTTAQRMEAFLAQLEFDRQRILLVAPPALQLAEWEDLPQVNEQSEQLAASYRALADRLAIRFADANNWGVELAYDGIHFTGEGHKAFAAGLLEVITQ